MKRLSIWVSTLFLTILCVLCTGTSALAVDFPTLSIDYDAANRSVIVTGVPMFDSTGTIQYTLDGKIFFNETNERVCSFCYAPEFMPYDLPEQQGYIFNWDDAQFLLYGSGKYTIQARLTAHPRENTGKTLEKGPQQSLTYDYRMLNDVSDVTTGAAPTVTAPTVSAPTVTAPQMVNVIMDGDGGTFRNSEGMDCFDSEFPFEAGKTLASTGYTIDTITCLDKEFRGWIAYDKSGSPLSSLMTTEEVLNYPIPDHNIRFEIQWDKREGYPVTAITYAAIINGTGQPDSNVRVTLEVGGVRYSGYGSVTISKEVYSQWKGNMKVIWECPGQYIRANNRWIPDYFEFECSVSSFKKEKNCYNSISATGKGKEVTSPRDVINDLYYSVRNDEPEISRAHDATVTILTPSSAPVPEIRMTTAQLQSGSTFETSMAAMKKATMTDNVLVFDITAKDADGNALHQLGGTAEVTIPLPKDYIIQPGNTALVYYLPGDGTAVPCETALHDEDPQNRWLTFTTDHFSLYAVAEVAKAPEPPKQPDTPADLPTTPTLPTSPTTPIEPPAPKPTVTPGDITVVPGDSGVVPTQPDGPPDAPVNPTTPAVPPADPSVPSAGTPSVPSNSTDVSTLQPQTPANPVEPPAAKPVPPAAPSAPAASDDVQETAALPVWGIAAAVAAVAAAIIAAAVLLKKKNQ